MQNSGSKLDDLRREIDRIDDAMHDFLMRRAETTREIAKVKGTQAKGGVPAIRPAREATILRRLMARHDGTLPRAVMVRVWREILAASLQVQTPFRAHVCAGENQSAFLEVARAYFGSQTPIRVYERATQVLYACAEDSASLGLVPPPVGEEVAPWWEQLAPAGERGPRVLAKLPFLAGSDQSAGEKSPPAYVLGAVEQESTGDDTTLLRLETVSDLSHAKLRSLLEKAGLPARVIATGHPSPTDPGALVLLEVAGFVAPGNPQLTKLTEVVPEAITRAVPVGGFANPFVSGAKGKRS